MRANKRAKNLHKMNISTFMLTAIYQDIISYVTDMKLQFPSLPLFYMGLHSTGTSVNSHLNRPVNPQYM